MRSSPKRESKTKCDEKYDIVSREKNDKQTKKVTKDKSIKLKTTSSKSTEEKPKLKKIHVNFEYFDGGSHWCRYCNVISDTINDFCDHLHSVGHQKVLFIVVYYLVDRSVPALTFKFHF